MSKGRTSVRSSSEPVAESLESALCNYFWIVYLKYYHQHTERHAFLGEMNGLFEPTRSAIAKLTKKYTRRAASAERLAFVLDEFTENLIKSGSYTADELSVFWDIAWPGGEAATEGLRLLGATTMASVVEKPSELRPTRKRNLSARNGLKP